MNTPTPWYYVKDGQQQGPVSTAELQRLAGTAELLPDDYVWRETFTDWVRASSIPNLIPTTTSDPELTEPPTPAAATGTSSQPPADNSHRSAPKENASDAGTTTTGEPATSPTTLTTAPVTATTKTLSPTSSVASTASTDPVATSADSPDETGATTAPATQLATRSTTLTTREGELSTSAQQLKTTLSKAVWQELQQAGYDASQQVFWTQLKSATVQEKPPETPQAASANLLKSFSDTLSKVASTVDLPLNRFLVVTADDSLFVTSDLGVSCDVWRLDLQQFAITTRWDAQHLDVTLQAQSAEVPIQSATCRLDISKKSAVRSGGEPYALLRHANAGLPSDDAATHLAYPLNTQQSRPLTNAFFQTLTATCRITCVTLADQCLRLIHRNKEETLAFADIVAWKPFPDGLELLVLEPAGVRRVVITVHGQVSIPELSDKLDLPEHDATSEDESTAGEEEAATTNSAETESSSETEDLPEATEQPGGVSPRDLGANALATLTAELEKHCPATRCSTLSCAAQFSPQPLLGATAQKILIVIRDGDCRAYSGDGPYAKLIEQPQFTSCTLGQQTYIQLETPGAYQVHPEQGETAEMLWQAMNTLTARRADPERTQGVVASIVTAEEPQTLLMRLLDNGQLAFFDGATIDDATPTLTCPISAIASQSSTWTVGWGTTEVQFAGEPQPRQLTAANDVLIALWESKKLAALNTTLAGVSLGELYAQYNQSRSDKFLSGVFGNFILANQRLELTSSVASLMEAIESAPPGPLPEELENQLLERLSILEVSRHQLNRWMERCTLMYPHYRAQMEREWLDHVFGNEHIDASFREREAWRVHQQTRSELRQVQASMGRAMNEVGQNLQMISFAFPEEVRCAALAATRRAADMADKGAMLALFGGMGGQLLMGIGRASMGDPLGFAMVGAIGLSLVGKHLQKKAKEKEKKIRLRAYGGQALQWWSVALETAVVMSLECQHALEQSHQAAMARDRKVLEGIPRDKLPKIQQRMVDTMRTTMKHDVSSQFYEALPGSGIFGWHIVDQIIDANRSKPAEAITGFQRELPGSIGKE